MLHVRFRRTKHPKWAVDYLLGPERDRALANVIRGDIDLSLEIAENNPHKDKYSAGCLAFEEPDLSEEVKRKIMHTFERTLFPGLDESQYDICWVQHTDKGKLELNYFIPQVELTSGKALTAYYHAADRDRLRDFSELINRAYKLSSTHKKPKDLADLNWRKRTPEEIKKLGQEITNKLIESEPEIHTKSQAEIIQIMEQNGYEVARRKSGKNIGEYAVSKYGISIVNPTDDEKPNIRLKGRLYSQSTKPQKVKFEDLRMRWENRLQIKADAQRKRYPRPTLDKIKHERPRRNQSIISQCHQVIANAARRVKQAIISKRSINRYRSWHDQSSHYKVLSRQGQDPKQKPLRSL